jgi:hypothetical protein
MEVQLLPVRNLALGGGWSAPCSGRFTPVPTAQKARWSSGPVWGAPNLSPRDSIPWPPNTLYRLPESGRYLNILEVKKGDVKQVPFLGPAMLGATIQNFLSRVKWWYLRYVRPVWRSIISFVREPISKPSIRHNMAMLNNLYAATALSPRERSPVILG